MIYERIISLFPGMQVTVAEEDVEFSVEGNIEGLPVRYILQIIGETQELKGAQIAHFAGRLLAHNASKGYIIHSHRIRTKHRQMNQAKGIEFLRLDQFISDDFAIEPEVPVKYFHPSLRNAEVTQAFYLNNEMLLNRPKKFTKRPEDEGIVSLDRGITLITIGSYIVQKYLERKPNIIANEKLDLKDEQVYIRLNDVWLLTDISVAFKWSKPAYLIFLKASEITQYKGQWKGKPVSTDFKLKQFQLPPRERWIIIGNPHTMPVRTNLLLEGIYVVPEDMTQWIPEHVSYNND